MSVFLDVFIENIEPCFSIFSSSLLLFVDVWESLTIKGKERWLSFDYDIHFDKAQINAIGALLFIIFINSICIFFIWKFHGHRIYKRFKKPAPPKVFEELSRSVANLKLPKVHSPRM